MHRAKRKLGLTVAIVFTTFVIAVIALYCVPIGERTEFREKEFTEVVKAIEHDTLKPSEKGVVRLPERWAATSICGKVYVRRDTNGRLVVFFPSWVGRNHLLIGPLDFEGDAWCEGYIYDSGAPGAKQSDGKFVSPPGPPCGPLWEARVSSEVDEWNLCNLTRVNAHWFAADIFS